MSDFGFIVRLPYNLGDVLRYGASLVAITIAISIALLALAIEIAKLAVIMYQVSIADFEPCTLTVSPGQSCKLVVSCLVTGNTRIGCVAAVLYSSSTITQRVSVVTSTTDTIAVNITLMFTAPTQKGTYTALGAVYDPGAKALESATVTLHFYVGTTASPPPPPPPPPPTTTSTRSTASSTTTSTTTTPAETLNVAPILIITLATLLLLARRETIDLAKRY